MIGMQPALGRMEVAMLPALNREFQTFDLAASSPAEAAAE
jgi:hypothetical protein